jgi:hypothetical protein
VSKITEDGDGNGADRAVTAWGNMVANVLINSTADERLEAACVLGADWIWDNLIQPRMQAQAND